MRRYLSMKQGGFNLIELMLVIALLVILLVFAVPSYQQMVQNSMTRTATESIKNGFLVARSEAVKRNTNVQFDFLGKKSDWTVCTSPIVPGSCPAPNGATTIDSRNRTEGSSDTIVVAASAAGPYVFNGFGVMTSPGAVTIDISNSATAADRSLRVVVDAGGAVRACDPAVAGTDPRRC